MKFFAATVSNYSGKQRFEGNMRNEKRTGR